MRICPHCQQPYKPGSKTQTWCKPCNNQRAKEFRRNNPEIVKEYSRKVDAKLRLEVFTHYGKGILACVCCGEDTWEFLALDHMNNDGASQRREHGTGLRYFYWLKRNGWPEGLQILCYNCNCAKAYYGICPHQRDKEYT